MRLIEWENLVTNESLDAVVTGLNLSSQDSVSSICGSGDQTFAILEKVKKVVVVDVKYERIEYLLQRKRLLESGDYKGFLDPKQNPKDKIELRDLKLRNSYFSLERLGRIQAKLMHPDSLREVTDDVFQFDIPFGEFDKFYLSNVLSFDYGNQNIDLLTQRLKRFADLLPKDGLIYISDGSHTIKRASFLGYSDDLLNKSNLDINVKLTEVAQKHQETVKQWGTYWMPVVLQKV